MKCRLRKFSFNSFTATLFHSSFDSSFVREKIFYSKNIQYAYNFYGTDLYINVCSGVFITESSIYGEASSRKSQKSFIVDIRLCSKYTFGIGFTVEKVYKMSIFV